MKRYKVIKQNGNYYLKERFLCFYFYITQCNFAGSYPKIFRSLEEIYDDIKKLN